jgi:hypothetical protein
MKVKHRGYEIVAAKKRALGGWTDVYWHACRTRDGYMLFDGFGDYSSPREAVKWMRRCIDVLIDKFGERVDRLYDAIDTAAAEAAREGKETT